MKVYQKQKLGGGGIYAGKMQDFKYLLFFFPSSGYLSFFYLFSGHSLQL